MGLQRHTSNLHFDNYATDTKITEQENYVLALRSGQHPFFFFLAVPGVHRVIDVLPSVSKAQEGPKNPRGAGGGGGASLAQATKSLLQVGYALGESWPGPGKAQTPAKGPHQASQLELSLGFFCYTININPLKYF